ncbi:hypothetical protein EON80_17475, partial [bacterium]
GLNARSPACVVWVQGVLPVHPVHWRDHSLTESSGRALAYNAQVRSLNEQLAAQAQKHGALFFDVHPFFEAEGALRAECTLDGLHLNGVGYRVWREAMQSQAPAEVRALLNSPSR